MLTKNSAQYERVQDTSQGLIERLRANMACLEFYPSYTLKDMPRKSFLKTIKEAEVRVFPVLMAAMSK